MMLSLKPQKGNLSPFSWHILYLSLEAQQDPRYIHRGLSIWFWSHASPVLLYPHLIGFPPSLARGLCPRWPCSSLAEYISFLGLQPNVLAGAVWPSSLMARAVRPSLVAEAVWPSLVTEAVWPSLIQKQQGGGRNSGAQQKPVSRLTPSRMCDG